MPKKKKNLAGAVLKLIIILILAFLANGVGSFVAEMFSGDLVIDCVKDGRPAACSRDYGWPLVYHHYGGDFEPTERLPLNFLLNILFWFMILLLIFRLVRKRKFLID